MARIGKKAAVVWLVLLMVISILPVSAAEGETDAKYYGEAYLELKTEEQKTAYRLLEEGIAGLSPLITFEGIVEIKYGQIPDVLRAVCVDNPQYFWFLEAGKCNYSQVDYGNLAPVISFEPSYILNGNTVTAGSQALADAMYEFHSVVRRIIDEIPVNLTTEYEIALYLHDYLAQNVTYTLEGEHPSAYAALVQGQAACYGYSKAYQCLLNAAGIRARTITGDSPGENGRMVGHAWNQVWLDGKCLYVDVTWDDLEEVTVHSYFACSLERMALDHFADQDFLLGACGHDDMQVYSKDSIAGIAQWGEHTSAREAAGSFRLEYMDQGYAAFTCELEFTGSDFLSWFRRYSGEIFDLLAISNAADVFYYELGNVYQLTVTDSYYRAPVPRIHSITLDQEYITLPGSGSRYQLRPVIDAVSPWDPLLVYTSSDVSVATVDQHGLVTAVGEGTAVITAANEDGSVCASCEIQVLPAAEHKHTMRHFGRVESTCTQDGHEAYYLCTGCGCRFADEAGNTAYTQTSAYMIPARHNKLIYKNLGQYHVQRCKCGEELTDTKQPHTDENSDGVCDVCNLPTRMDDPIAPTVPDKDPLPGKKSPVVPIVLAVGGVGIAVAAFFLIKRKIRGY